MEVRNRRLFVVLGDGPIVLGAIAPAILESTKKKVLIVTRKDVYESINDCFMTGVLNERYPLAYASEEFLSLDNFLEYMEKSAIHVGIVSMFHTIFKEIVTEIDGGLCMFRYIFIIVKGNDICGLIHSIYNQRKVGFI